MGDAHFVFLSTILSAALQPTIISESARLPLPPTSGEPKPSPPSAGNELAIQIQREYIYLYTNSKLVKT